ncbi:hypothetical protein JB92DRAFT_2729836 [Gautieria morchelliformis]|nr:hypothetical protein JB92DRAFT_2729836 [Gautieria morchelliformis]
MYDHMLTLELEVKLVWPASWSIAKVLFFATRYLVFADVSLNLCFHLAPASISPKLCTFFFLLSGSLIMLGILIAELTLVFRTWVIWGRDRKMALILLTTTLLLSVPTAVLAYFGWKTMECGYESFYIGSRRVLISLWARSYYESCPTAFELLDVKGN